MTFNSRSLCNKTTGVTEFLKDQKCDVCFITEAWLKLKDTATVAKIKESGFLVKFQPRKGKRGGGVCVLYKENIDLKKCNICHYKSFEVLEVVIKGKLDLLRVSTFYRTGKMSTENRASFSNDLDDYLQNLMLKRGEKILCGDFNVHVENKLNLDRKALYDITESYSFVQLVKEPTHKEGGTLDLIFCQNFSKYYSLINDSVLIHDLCFSVTSDHNFIEFVIPFANSIQTKVKEFSYRDFKKVNVEAFCADVVDVLSCQNFFTENVDSTATDMYNSLSKAIDKHAPLINVSIKPKKTPFTNTDIITLRRKRRKAERQFRKYGNPNNKKRYQSLVKDVQKLVKGSRNNYYEGKLIDCKDNKKEKFKLFRKMLGTEEEKQLPCHENELTLCNEFEQFFHNKIHNIRNKIMTTTSPVTSLHNFQRPSVCVKFDTFASLDDDKVIEIFNDLPNKHCELDPASCELFKQCLPELLPYVKYTINLSLRKGTFPSAYKEALLKPKLKTQSLDNDIHNNYRPLSNLSFLSKALERCVLQQLVNHLEINNLFGDFQSAYRKFHSCETAITKITNDILLSLDKKECSFLLFLDLSSAFDTVDHDILLSNLKGKYGIEGIVLQWFESYLKGRKYKVKIGKSYSKGIFLYFGVPQGSILGPILFILYISDIEHIAKCYGFRVHVYADDTQLYISFSPYDILSTVSNIEHCLREIKYWMSNNFLKLNEDKTKFLLISSKDDLHNIYTDLCISFSGNIISPAMDAVNLGVTIDSDMSMEAYINSIISKGYCHLNNFWKAANKLNWELKLQLVTSFVLPLIDYCNITFLAASQRNVNKLQKLLNSSIRFIFNLCGKRYRLPTTDYMKRLHILPVEYRVKYKLSLLVYKCINGIAPTYLQDLITPNITYSHLRSSSNLYDLQPIVPKSKYGESAFSYAAPVTWNELPNDIKFSPNVESFKTKLKTHYFIEYYGNE